MKKICSRFSDIDSHDIDSTVYGVQRDKPPACELNIIFSKPWNKIVTDLYDRSHDHARLKAF